MKISNETKARIVRERNALEELRVSAVQNMPAIEHRAFQRVWKIFSGSVIRPEAAPFVVGRLFEALAEYTEATEVIDKCGELDAKLVEYAKIEEALGGIE